ncbi:MAG: hypothetical protein LQ345_001264 [Seirophora villosa]|nr:MAG: hypothetical protein LQ345_001264 [Seirophora villosa]
MAMGSTSPLPDPFIYHPRGAASTWEFFGRPGILNPRAALGAWTAAYWDAERRINTGQGDQPLGSQTRKWSAAAAPAAADDALLILIPKPEMTWRMLAEAYKGAELLICKNGREFRFRVLVEGKEGNVGFGDTMMRRRGSAAAAAAAAASADRDDRGLTVRRRRRNAELGGLMRRPGALRLPEGKTTAVNIPQPFHWHHSGMVSTWVFYDYHGHFNHNAAAMAAQAALSDAMFGHPRDSQIGQGTKVWSGTYRDAGTVDLILNARPGMTWRMLIEGITGAQMLAYEGKEYQFMVLAEGFDEHVGFGQVRRRVASSLGRLVARDARWIGPTSRMTAAAGRVPAALSSTRLKSLQDPYIHHDPNMISTWEYYGYNGEMNAAGCMKAWTTLYEEARRQVNLGRSNVPVGTATKHWAVNHSDEWVDLVLIPRETMTWRMLKEGMYGGITVCANLGKNFQFIVLADGVEGEVGYGQMTARPSQVTPG